MPERDARMISAKRFGMEAWMKKRGFIISAALLALLAAAGCGARADNEDAGTPTEVAVLTDTPATPTPEDKKYRVGSAVSDAFVDPSAIPTVAPDAIKAKGYEYDYETLTYELVWSDEFDYEGAPDDEKWDYDTGGSGWGNNELQYYTKGENVEVRDGLLVIEARKEAQGTKDYTSTRLVSRGKGDWLYGRIEVCAKLPSGVGTWPAIWMLPTDWKYGDWPASGEIDIMEHVGYDQGAVHASVHTKTYNHSIGTQKTARINSETVSEEFHVYALEWLPDKIIVSMDGEAYFSFEPTKYKSSPTFEEWPFDKRMHLLINFAVGGNWGGQRGVDDSVYPQGFEVDYVRVYQSPEITALTEEKQ